MFFEDVLLMLRDAGVRFVVVGGTAVILHGVPRTTADLDLVIDLDAENVRRLLAAMNRLGYRPRVPVPASDLADPQRRQEWIEDKGMRAFTFCRPGRPLDDVDIVIDSPVDFGELSRRAERIDVEGLVLPIAAIEDLIRMKEAAAREQDVADTDALRRLLEDQRRG